jgi:hypothetical protein
MCEELDIFTPFHLCTSQVLSLRVSVGIVLASAAMPAMADRLVWRKLLRPVVVVQAQPGSSSLSKALRMTYS